MSYEFIDHTGELAIRVSGSNVAELFVNAALALNEYLGEGQEKGTLEDWEGVYLSAMDKNSLLVAWLSEILYRITVNHRIYSQFRIEKLSEQMLSAQISGHKVKGLGREIKAVTHHGLEIKKVNGKYEVVVVFDI